MERKDYKRYSREFKLEAVRLAAVGDRPKAQIARELGIRVNQLRKWRLDFEEEERTGAPKRVLTSEDDLGRLRRENAKLKEENEILKKAVGIFTVRPREIPIHQRATGAVLPRGSLQGNARVSRWFLRLEQTRQECAPATK